jgi:phosphoribosyl-ATP pyrophosphohydrolase/phosphoribosyl-AMP cyclohydrolase
MTDKSQTDDHQHEIDEKKQHFINNVIEQIDWGNTGLIPAVVQDMESGLVLMVAYMNPDALRLTLEKGETYFWSRSRQELWHKGETSGHTQRVVGIYVDCDNDTLLLKVIPEGPACHTGQDTCFYRPLEEIIESVDTQHP